jgi:hypothetical protein
LIDSTGLARTAEIGAERAQPHARAQSAERIARRVGEIATWRDHHDHFFGDGLERSAKMASALEHQNSLVLGLDAEMSETSMVLIVFSAGYWLQGNRIEAIRLFPKR